jgi:hypothetical protein
LGVAPGPCSPSAGRLPSRVVSTKSIALDPIPVGEGCTDFLRQFVVGQSRLRKVERTEQRKSVVRTVEEPVNLVCRFRQDPLITPSSFAIHPPIR